MRKMLDILSKLTKLIEFKNRSNLTGCFSYRKANSNNKLEIKIETLHIHNPPPAIEEKTKEFLPTQKC